MTQASRDASFKPSLSRAESKADSVSRIAMSMVEQEIVKRDAKTARLREARLAREAATQAEAPVPVARVSRTKKKTATSA